MKLTKTKISNIYKYYKLCFQNWIRGNGFRLPDPPPRLRCFYEYCQKIVNGTLESPITAYEWDLIAGMTKHNCKSREGFAKSFIIVYEELYIQNKPW